MREIKRCKFISNIIRFVRVTKSQSAMKQTKLYVRYCTAEQGTMHKHHPRQNQHNTKFSDVLERTVLTPVGVQEEADPLDSRSYSPPSHSVELLSRLLSNSSKYLPSASDIIRRISSFHLAQMFLGERGHCPRRQPCSHSVESQGKPWHR